MLTTTGTFKCAFCSPAEAKILNRNDHALAILDRYPVTEGHTLVLPRRHVPRFFDLRPEESAALWQLVAEVRGELERNLNADGFNVAINDGPAAGQTVMHCHVHVIPRRLGDAREPRGGIRWVFPDKAPYWEKLRE
jgi:diadenosine tetraphosphate (Ap4A) HIT family hydrolase